jgi:WD40 repeat protein
MVWRQVGVFCILTARLSAELPQPPLVLKETIPLTGVEGPISGLSVDKDRKNLFVAASGHKTIEVIELASGNRTKTIEGVAKPLGVLFLPDIHRLAAVSDDGQLRFFNSAYQVSGAVMSLTHVETLQHDWSRRMLYVGFGDGAVTAVDVDKRVRVATVELDSHPAAMLLESKSPRMYVNMPRDGQLAIIDRDKQSLTTVWPLTEARDNHALAIDEANRRLFVGCRNPAKLIVLDCDSGKSIAGLDLCGRVETMHYDATRKRIYATCGEGHLQVIEQKEPDQYSSMTTLVTSPATGASQFVPETGRLYVAVPQWREQRAEVRVYLANP